MVKPSFEAARRKSRYGRCRICQRAGKLTKEHIPPEKAFNNSPYLRYYADETEKNSHLRWIYSEENTNGIYVFSLCEKCNNQTGHRYGSDYVRFVESFIPYAIPKNADKSLKIEIKNFFPLRVIKQAISMILSTSKPTSFLNHQILTAPKTKVSLVEDIGIKPLDKSHLQNLYQQLREFVRRRDLIGLPPNVRLYVFASVNVGSGLRTDIFGWADLETKNVIYAAEVGLYPILWLLVLDGEVDKKLLDVTDWADFGYKERKSIEVEMPFNWFLGKYPLDFRSPEELNTQHFISSMLAAGLKFSSDNLSQSEQSEEAIYFARVLGKVTKEGYLISEFEFGVFIEFGEVSDWLRDENFENAKQYIERRIEQRK